MPELAEVEFFRKRWTQAARGQRVVRVHAHDGKKILRGIDLPAFRRALTGATLESSEARAKQMLFRFNGGHWLGVHLGMSGELTVAPPAHMPGKHDHLILVMEKCALVFTDPRMFGLVRFHRGEAPPPWWTSITPALTSPAFSCAAVAAFLRRGRDDVGRGADPGGPCRQADLRRLRTRPCPRRLDAEPARDGIRGGAEPV